MESEKSNTVDGMEDWEYDEIMGGVFTIRELMDELDCLTYILAFNGYPKHHPEAITLEEGIQFILSDFSDKQQRKIIQMVNDLRCVPCEDELPPMREWWDT